MLAVVCWEKDKKNDDSEVDMAGWRRRRRRREKLEVQRQLTKKVQISIRQSTRFPRVRRGLLLLLVLCELTGEREEEGDERRAAAFGEW